MDNQSFYKYVEGRGLSGYGSAILVREPGATKYSLLLASETVPAIFGTPNSFEFDLVNSRSIGKIQGKASLDDKDVEFLLHRDNIYRLEQLRDKVLDFMYITPDLMGWKFAGKISARPNDAGSDVLRGTYTITPMSADDKPILNVRDEIQETLCFANAIPETIKSGDSINLSVVQKDATVTYTQQSINSDGTKKGTSSSVAVSDGVGSITLSGGGLVAITASADNYASWTTTIYVEP